MGQHKYVDGVNSIFQSALKKYILHSLCSNSFCV